MRRHSLAFRAHRRQRGTTMIELLVAFVIFSFGMLGLAGLQTKILAQGQSGLYRSQAAALTADVLDQMRSSIIAARAGKWNTTTGTHASSVTVTGGGIADTELQKWKRQVETQLPGGEASITVDASVAGVNNSVTIVIQWDDSRGREAVQSFTTVSRL